MSNTIAIPTLVLAKDANGASLCPKILGVMLADIILIPLAFAVLFQDAALAVVMVLSVVLIC